MITENQVNYLQQPKALETLEIVAERESNRRDKSVATRRQAIIEGLYHSEHKGEFIADTLLNTIYGATAGPLGFMAIFNPQDDFTPQKLGIIAGILGGWQLAGGTIKYFRARRYKKEMDWEKDYQLEGIKK